MFPSRHSSPDPNAAYTVATSPFVGNLRDAQDRGPDDVTQDAPSLHQPAALAGLQPTRPTNRDRLNAIARNVRPHVGTAVELMAHRNASASTTDDATSSAAPVTVNTIRAYLRARGGVEGVSETTLQNRLYSADLSAETLFFALQVLADADHPLLSQLNMGNKDRDKVMYRLTGIAMNKSGFLEPIRNVAKNAQDNPEQLIANMLEYVRKVGR